MQLFDTNLVIAAEPIDPAFVGTPQEFFDHTVERMSIKSPSPLYTVVVADSAPLSNQGLLLLGGLKPYAWDEDQSKYVPVDITDSLDVEPADKYVLVSDAGTWLWKKSTDFFTWIGATIASLTAGAAGTIAYSNGTTNAWGTPDNALPTKSVAITKLKCDAADANKFAMGNADGSVTWSAVGSARGQFLETAEYSLPTKGTTLTIPRPAGARFVQAVLVAKASPLFIGVQDNAVTGDYGYSVSEEVDIFSADEAVGDGVRWRAFNIATSASSWFVIRQKDSGGTSGTELIKRDSSGNPPEINDANWKIKIIYV